jgi:hypothetical protein
LPDHFTNLANIIALPKSLQSLSEWKPVADVLKYHSYHIYGYMGPNNKIPILPQYYPTTWTCASILSDDKIQLIVDHLQDQNSRRPMYKNN